MEKKIKVAAVGDNCVDAYDQTGEAFPGGNPVNVAVYTVRLGGEASYTGVVGDDAYGKLMKDSIAKKGVDVSHLKVMPGSTAVTHVEIIDGERILGDYEEGVMAEFKLSEEDIEFLGSHDLVVSGIWGIEAAGDGGFDRGTAWTACGKCKYRAAAGGQCRGQTAVGDERLLCEVGASDQDTDCGTAAFTPDGTWRTGERRVR